MTIEELYEWAKNNSSVNKQVVIRYQPLSGVLNGICQFERRFNKEKISLNATEVIIDITNVV